MPLVESEFGFLAEMGFHGEKDSEQSVLFRNDDGRFVRVILDTKDEVVDVRVGSAGQPRDALTIDEIMRLEGAPNPRHGFPEIEDTLHYLIARAAYKLRSYGGRAIAGDAALFEEAKALRRSQTTRHG